MFVKFFKFCLEKCINYDSYDKFDNCYSKLLYLRNRKIMRLTDFVKTEIWNRI